ncbi:MAG: hypothetical protein IJO46_04005 [Thermoguttaceae bacterium]|nr:hypothetical protein [Thermoguttaceae bacterium]MBQ7029232.1 hypothetical protein [Thermoguttaceae bacterium]MBQ7112092.1 hypothetical protein [Thermoguttaceae bacterium]
MKRFWAVFSGRADFDARRQSVGVKLGDFFVADLTARRIEAVASAGVGRRLEGL